METARLLLETVSLLLGFIALYLAIKHLKGIHEQRAKLDVQAKALNEQAARLDAQLREQANMLVEQAAKLEETQRSLPTGFIGVFPNFIPRITELIKRASVSVSIVCDFPSYGHYSDLPDWLDYRLAIIGQSNKIPVSITCYDEIRRERCHEIQFSEETGLHWNEYKKRPEARRLLKRFLEAHERQADDAAVDALEQDKFARLLEEADKEMLAMAFKKPLTKQIRAHIPLYFWLIDEGGGMGEAIFSIPSFSNKQLEYGFHTTAPKLISAFAEMKNRYQSDDN